MCDFKKQSFEPAKQAQQWKKLWQLDASYHCAVLGTCLTITELKKVIRQSGLQVPPDYSGYDVHRYLVGLADQPCRATKLLNKLLDRKYQGVIRQIKEIKDAKKLEGLWSSSSAKGDIAGMFWGIVCHPYADQKLRIKVYGEVHMLSHLEGASNRADLKQMHLLQQQVEEAHAASSKQQNRHAYQLASRDSRIRVLEQELLQLRQQAAKPAARFSAPGIDKLQHQVHKAEERADTLNHRYQALLEKLNQYEEKNARLQAECCQLQDELAASEHMLALANDKQMFDCDLTTLAGKNVAYIGGRASLAQHMKSLVETYNGSFTHHDGGKEESSAAINCLLSRADMVFCPIDCVSHDACLKVKKFCKQHTKRFVPLRSSGLSSFAQGLHRVLQQEQSPGLSSNDGGRT